MSVNPLSSTGFRCGVHILSDGGAQCAGDATYSVSHTCTGCPESKRSESSDSCESHLAMHVRGNLTCTICGVVQVVTGWTNLPVINEPRTPEILADPAANPRIGDTQRTAATERLGDAFAGGFISRDEFDSFASRIQSAVRESDLAAITADLPLAAVIAAATGLTISTGDTLGSMHRRRFDKQSFFIGVLTGAALLLLFLVWVGLLTGTPT